MDLDLAAHSDQGVQRRLCVVVPFQDDAGFFQGIGHCAEHHLHRDLDAIGLDAYCKSPLDIQRSQIAAKGGVVDLILLGSFQAGQLHHPGRVARIAQQQLTCALRIGDIGQAQVCGSDHQGQRQAGSHKAEYQCPMGSCTAAAFDQLFDFSGNDKEHLLSFLVRPAPGAKREAAMCRHRNNGRNTPVLAPVFPPEHGCRTDGISHQETKF